MSTSSIRGEKRRRAFARTESSIRGESEKHRLSHTKISRQGCSIRPTVCVAEQDARLRASKQRNASKATRSTPLLLQTAPNAFGSRLRDLRPGLRIANNFVAKCTANESAAQRCQRPSPRARTTSRRCKTQKPPLQSPDESAVRCVIINPTPTPAPNK